MLKYLIAASLLASSSATAQTMTPEQEAWGTLAYTAGRCHYWISARDQVEYETVAARGDDYTQGFMQSAYRAGKATALDDRPTAEQCRNALANAINGVRKLKPGK